MRPASDAEKYKILIHDIALYIPIAQLSQSVFDEYNSLLTRTIDSKANVISCHYRRSEVRPISIPSNSQEFYSGNILALWPCLTIMRSNHPLGDSTGPGWKLFCFFYKKIVHQKSTCSFSSVTSTAIQYLRLPWCQTKIEFFYRHTFSRWTTRSIDARVCSHWRQKWVGKMIFEHFLIDQMLGTKG